MSILRKIGQFLKEWGGKLWYFFPLQLVFIHLKYNQLLIGLWFVLVGFVLQIVGEGFGVPYLFLSPEYLGTVNPLSFFLLGFAMGGFIMAFHAYSYVTYGPSFKFIATLARPFLKFSINNSLIPLIFILIHAVQIIKFQTYEELEPLNKSLLFVATYLVGIAFFIVTSFLYFFGTNKDFFKFNKGQPKDKTKEGQTPLNTTLHKDENWSNLFRTRSNQEVKYYIGAYFRFKKARDFSHYDTAILIRVFNQNHINVSLFELMMLIAFFVLGIFRENAFFQVPSSVSIVLLFTIATMLFSALFSWIKGWTITFILGIFILLNFLTLHFDFFNYKNYAYGLDYNTEKADYTRNHLEFIAKDTLTAQQDLKKHENRLDLWRYNMVGVTGKPKLVIVNTSGGGLRSSMWTFEMFQYLDSLSGNQFSQHVQLISGASGGMVGASYYRELLLNYNLNKISLRDLHSENYLRKISMDLLNHVSITIATNDIFIRYQTVRDGKKKYTKDRGYAFEWQLMQNTDSVFDKRLIDYKSPVENGYIPPMIFSPTIINDGRRLLISSQDIAFMTSPISKDQYLNDKSIENVEFRRLFKEQDGDSLWFTSAIRMSATFPYILPMVSLPAYPHMEIMDAGIRDNYGVKVSMLYLYKLQKWINENTSGVIVVNIRDTKKDYSITPTDRYSLFDRLFRPLGNFYSNFPRTQDYNQDELMQLGHHWMEVPFNVVNFYLKENPKEKISLSWHLTNREKKIIRNAKYLPRIQKEIDRLLRLLNQSHDNR